MIDISYIDDEVEHEGPESGDPVPAPPERRRRKPWMIAVSIAAVVALFAVASLRTQPHSNVPDALGVGEVRTVGSRFGDQRWLRVTAVTLTAATAKGDPAALFIVEGRGWLPGQHARLGAEVCATGDVSDLGSWSLGPDGTFRYAHTDPGSGTFLLTIEGIASDPIRILIGGGEQRFLSSTERGCPNLA